MSGVGPLAFRVQPAITPAVHLAETRGALAARRPSLRVYDVTGEVLSLGRYHIAPAGARGVDLDRRLTGGRALAAGAGFVGVSLVLPHRSALAGDDPLALAPAQVMNRAVRGVMEALKASGVSPFYPGRDAITVDGRILGFVSFEVDAAGTLLFEALLANRTDFGRLPALLEAADPAGVVPAVFLPPEAVTSLGAFGRAVTTEALAAAIRRGYEAASGISLVDDPEPPSPPDEDRAAWVASRRARPGLERRAAGRIQLGMLEARVACADGRIVEAVVSGDFIADSPAIAALEAGLRGVLATRAGVAAVVDAVFSRPEHFILGVGPLATLTDTLAGALPA